MAVTVPNYLKNLTRSIKYATVDVSKEIAPNMHEFAETNKEFLVSTYSVLKNPKSMTKKKVESFTQSKTFKAVEYGTKNLFSDLLTGKFYNKEREAKATEQFGGSLVNFDFDDLSEFGIDKDWESNLDKADSTKHDDVVTTGDRKIIGAIEGSNATATAATVNAVISSSKYNAGIAKANTAMLYQQNEKLFGGLHKDLSIVGQTLANIQNINQKALGNIDSNMASFFTSSLKIQQENNAILKEIRDMQRDQYKSAKEKEEEARRKHKSAGDTYEDVMTGNVLDLSAYAKLVKKNTKNKINELTGGIGGMMDTFGDDVNPLAMMMASPLKFLTTSFVRSLIGGNTRKSIKRVDESFAGLFGTAIAKASNMRSGWGISDIIGSIFGVNTKMKTKLDTSKYEKGPIPFDGITKKSLIEVIPTYLRQITAAITGKDEIIFDYNTGKWVKYANAKKEISKVRKDARSEGSGDMVRKMRRTSEYRSSTSHISASRQDEIDDAFEEFQDYLLDNNGIFNPKRSASANGITSTRYPKLYKYYDLIKRSYASNEISNASRLGLADKVMRSKSSYNRRMERLESDSISPIMSYEAMRDVGHARGTFNAKGNTAINWILQVKDEIGNSVYDYLQNINKELTWQRANWAYGGAGGYAAPANSGPNAITQFRDIDVSNTGYLKEQAEIAKKAAENAPKRRRFNDYGFDFDSDAKEEGWLSKFIGRTKAGGFAQAVTQGISDSMGKLADKIDQSLYDMMFTAEVKDSRDNTKYEGFMDAVMKKTQKKFDELFDSLKENGKRIFIDPILKRLDDWGINHDKKEFSDTIKEIGSWFGTQFKKANKEVWIDPITKLMNPDKTPEQLAAIAREQRVKTGSESRIDKRKKQRESTADWSARYRDAANTIRIYEDGKPVHYTQEEVNKKIENLNKEYFGYETDDIKGQITYLTTWLNDHASAEDKAAFTGSLNGILSRYESGTADAKQTISALSSIKKKIFNKTHAKGTKFGKPFMGTSALSRNELLFNSKGISRVNKTGVYNITEPTHILNSEDSYDLMKGMGMKDLGAKSTISKDLANERKAINNVTGHADGTITEEEARTLKENAKKFAPKMAAGAVAGGLASSLLGLVGGPILGGAAGAGVMFLRESETAKNILFGKLGEDGERTGGLISKKIQDTVKKYIPNMAKYGLAGIIPGMITPFGPIGGLLIGSAIGWMKSNEDFREKMVGSLNIGEKEKSILKKMLPGAGKGAVAGAGLGLLLGGPFGLIGNAVLGSAVGMMSTTDEFKDAVFGREINGKRFGGLIQTISNTFQPLKDAGIAFKDKVINILDEGVMKPLNNFLIPFIHELPKIFGKIPKMINDHIKKSTGRSLSARAGRFIRNASKGKVGKAVGAVATAPIRLATLPFRALGHAGNAIRAKQIRNLDADYMTAKNRLRFMDNGKNIFGQSRAGYSNRKFDMVLSGIGDVGSESYNIAQRLQNTLLDIGNSRDTIESQRLVSEENMDRAINNYILKSGKSLRRGDINRINKLAQTGDTDKIEEILVGAGLSRNEIDELMEGKNGIGGIREMASKVSSLNDRARNFRGKSKGEIAKLLKDNKETLEVMGINVKDLTKNPDYLKKVLANLDSELANRQAGGKTDTKYQWDHSMFKKPYEDAMDVFKKMQEAVDSIAQGLNPEYKERREKEKAAEEAAKSKVESDKNALLEAAKEKYGEKFESLSDDQKDELTRSKQNLLGKSLVLGSKVISKIPGVNMATRFFTSSDHSFDSWVDTKIAGKFQSKRKNEATRNLKKYSELGLSNYQIGSDFAARYAELKKTGISISNKASDFLAQELDSNEFGAIVDLLSRKDFKKFIGNSKLNKPDIDYFINNLDNLNDVVLHIKTANKNGISFSDIGSIPDLMAKGIHKEGFNLLNVRRKGGIIKALFNRKSEFVEPTVEAEEGTPENPAQNGIGTLLLGGLSTLGGFALSGAKLVGKAALGLGKAAVGGVKKLFSGKKSGGEVAGYGTGGANAATNRAPGAGIGGGTITGDADKAGDGRSIVQTSEGPAKVIEKSDGSVEYDTSDNKTKDVLNKISFKDKLQEKMAKAQEKTSSIMEKVFNPKKENKGLGLLGKLFLGGLLLKSGILGKVWNGIIKPIWTEKIRPFLKETVFPKIKEIWNDKVKPFFGNLLKGAGNWVLNTGIPFLVKAIKAVIAAIFGKSSGDSTASAVGNAISHGASIGTVVGAAVNGLNGGTYRYGTSGSGEELVEKYGEDVQTEMYDEKGNKLTTSDIANGNYERLYNAQGYEAKINSDGTYTFTNRVSPWFKYAGTVTNAAAHAFVNPNVARAGTKILTGALSVGKHVPGLKTVSKLASIAVKPTTTAINAAANAGSNFFGIAANPTISERLTNWQINNQIKKGAVEGITKNGSVVEQTAGKISYLSNKTNKLYEKAAGDKVFKEVATSADNVLASSSDNILAKAATEGAEATAKNKGLVASIVEKTKNVIDKLAKNAKVQKFVTKVGNFFHVKDLKNFASTLFKTISEKMVLFVQKAGAKFGKEISEETAKKVAAKAIAIVFLVTDFVKGADQAEAILGVTKTSFPEELCAGLVNALCNFLIIPSIIPGTPTIAQTILECIYKLGGKESDLKERQEEAEKEYQEYIDKTGSTISKEEYLKRKYSVTGKIKGFVTDKIAAAKDWYNNEDKGTLKATINDLKEGDFLGAGKNLLGTGVKTLMRPVVTAGKLAKGVLKGAGSVVGGVGKGLWSGVKGVGSSLKDFVTGHPVKALGDLASGALGLVTNPIKGIGKGVVNVGKGVVDAAKNSLAGRAVKSAVKGVKKLGSKIKGLFSKKKKKKKKEKSEEEVKAELTSADSPYKKLLGYDADENPIYTTDKDVVGETTTDSKDPLNGIANDTMSGKATIFGAMKSGNLKELMKTKVDTKNPARGILGALAKKVALPFTMINKGMTNLSSKLVDEFSNKEENKQLESTERELDRSNMDEALAVKDSFSSIKRAAGSAKKGFFSRMLSNISKTTSNLVTSPFRSVKSVLGKVGEKYEAENEDLDSANIDVSAESASATDNDTSTMTGNLKNIMGHTANTAFGPFRFIKKSISQIGSEFSNISTNTAETEDKLMSDTLKSNKSVFSKDYWTMNIKNDDTLSTPLKQYATAMAKVASAPIIIVKKIISKLASDMGPLGEWIKENFEGYEGFFGEPKSNSTTSITKDSNYVTVNGKKVNASAYSASQAASLQANAARLTANYGKGYTKQIDPSVANIRYNAPGDTEYQTVGDSACGPVAAVNVLESFGRGSSAVKAATNMAINSGFKEKNGGTKPGFFKQYFSKAGLKTSMSKSISTIRNRLRRGIPTILMGKDPSGNSDTTPFGKTPHYVSVTGVDRNGRAIVQDPESRYDNQLYDINALLRKTTFGTSIYGKGTNFENSNQENARQIYAYLTQKLGYTPAAAAGFIGCWVIESHLNPNSIEGDFQGQIGEKIHDRDAMDDYVAERLFPIGYAHRGWEASTGKRHSIPYKAVPAGAKDTRMISSKAYLIDGYYYPGLGLAGYTGALAKGVMDNATKTGKPWNSLHNQLDYTRDLLQNNPYQPFRWLHAAAKTATDVKSATKAAANWFEGTNSWESDRYPAALEAYNKLNGSNYKYDESKASVVTNRDGTIVSSSTSSSDGSTTSTTDGTNDENTEKKGILELISDIYNNSIIGRTLNAILGTSSSSSNSNSSSSDESSESSDGSTSSGEVSTSGDGNGGKLDHSSITQGKAGTVKIATGLSRDKDGNYLNLPEDMKGSAAGLLSIAKREADDGYVEKKSNNNLGDPKANPGTNMDNWTKFSSWLYGDKSSPEYGWHQLNTPWCAAFLSWCANQAGVPNDIFHYTGGCLNDAQWFQAKGRLTTDMTKAQPGDIVYFDQYCKKQLNNSHVGIVWSRTGNNTINTIEGNSSDRATFRTRNASDPYIYGFARPDYQTPSYLNSSEASNMSTVGGTYTALGGNGEKPMSKYGQYLGSLYGKGTLNKYTYEYIDGKTVRYETPAQDLEDVRITNLMNSGRKNIPSERDREAIAARTSKYGRGTAITSEATTNPVYAKLLAAIYKAIMKVADNTGTLGTIVNILNDKLGINISAEEISDYASKNTLKSELANTLLMDFGRLDRYGQQTDDRSMNVIIQQLNAIASE